MRANEKRIMVENLGPRRFIVGVIEAYESVSQKRSKLAPGLSELFGRTRRLNCLRQVRVHLQFRMAVIVNSCGPPLSLAISENWLGHLEFPEFGGQRKQGISRGVSSCNFAQAVTQRQEGVERNQTLLIQNGPHSVGHQFMHALAFRSRLLGTRKQINDFVLRGVGFAGRHEQQVFQCRAARVEKLRLSADLAKGPGHFLPRIVQSGSGDFALARQYLPESDASLKGSEGIAP